MNNNFRIFLLLISILTPIFLITSGIRTALSPIFVNLEYKLPNFPPDTYGFSTKERLVWANYSIRYLSGKVSEEEFTTLQFLDGTPLFNEREISHMIDVHDLTLVMLAIWEYCSDFLRLYYFQDGRIIGFAHCCAHYKMELK